MQSTPQASAKELLAPCSPIVCIVLAVVAAIVTEKPPGNWTCRNVASTTPTSLT